MKWMQTITPLATAEKPAAESSIEALATTAALGIFNRCSGHGNDVLAAMNQDRARP